VAQSSATWHVAVVSAQTSAYEKTKLNVAVQVIGHTQHDEYHVLSKKLKSCARKLLTTIKRKMNEQNEEEAEALCEPMQK
jgi:hypothetical protein